MDEFTSVSNRELNLEGFSSDPLFEDMLKGIDYPVGTIRNGRKKVSSGKWEEVGLGESDTATHLKEMKSAKDRVTALVSKHKKAGGSKAQVKHLEDLERHISGHIKKLHHGQVVAGHAHKSEVDELEKGKRMPVGSISPDGQYRKVADGKWIHVRFKNTKEINDAHGKAHPHGDPEAANGGDSHHLNEDGSKKTKRTIDEFLSMVQADWVKQHSGENWTNFTTNFPIKATATVGKKYIKVLHSAVDKNTGKVTGDRHDIQMFIDKVTGDIFKPDTWSRPAKGVRGNMHDENPPVSLGETYRKGESDEMEKGHLGNPHSYPIGTVHGEYKKVGQGKWVKVKKPSKFHLSLDNMETISVKFAEGARHLNYDKSEKFYSVDSASAYIQHNLLYNGTPPHLKVDISLKFKDGKTTHFTHFHGKNSLWLSTTNHIHMTNVMENAPASVKNGNAVDKMNYWFDYQKGKTNQSPYLDSDFTRTTSYGDHGDNTSGVFSSSSWKSGAESGVMFRLDDFDAAYAKEVKLKEHEHVFRYETDTSKIGGMKPIIMINTMKGLLYFLTDAATEENAEKLTRKSFESKGIKVNWMRLNPSHF